MCADSGCTARPAVHLVQVSTAPDWISHPSQLTDGIFMKSLSMMQQHWSAILASVQVHPVLWRVQQMRCIFRPLAGRGCVCPQELAHPLQRVSQVQVQGRQFTCLTSTSPPSQVHECGFNGTSESRFPTSQSWAAPQAPATVGAYNAKLDRHGSAAAGSSDSPYGLQGRWEERERQQCAMLASNEGAACRAEQLARRLLPVPPWLSHTRFLTPEPLRKPFCICKLGALSDPVRWHSRTRAAGVSPQTPCP